MVIILAVDCRDGWPVTGSYDFCIASQVDVGGLWLSFDDHPANVNIVCFQPDHYGVRDKEFVKYAEQRSNPISLVEGQAYYYEVSLLQDLIVCLFLDTHSSLLLTFNPGPLGMEVLPAWYSQNIIMVLR